MNDSFVSSSELGNPAWVKRFGVQRLPPSTDRSFGYLWSGRAFAAKQWHSLSRAPLRAFNVPDMWINISTGVPQHRAPPDEHAHAFQEVRPGDTLFYQLPLPSVGHPLAYVGSGHIVDFCSRKIFLSSPVTLGGMSGMIRVTPVEEAMRKRRLSATLQQPRDCAMRRMVVENALSSVGVYRYHPMRFNCMHSAHAFAGGKTHWSITARLVGITVLSLVSVVVSLLVLLSLVLRRYCQT